MRHLILSACLFLACTAPATAQVVLQVTDRNTHTPVAHIQVQVKDGASGETDEAGQITLQVAAYPATIALKGLGFEDVRQKVTAPGTVSIELDSKAHSLDGTVVTGVPRPTRLKNALSQYRVITRADNDAQGNITLADALSTQLNINIGNDGILGSTIKMQGLSGNKVKVLIDGLPVNGRENGNIDMGQLSLNNVDHIEIIQGPMSVVYGSDALGGVINLISKQNKRPWEATGTFNYESVGKYNTDVALTRNWKHHHLNVGGGRNYFAGWKDLDSNSAGPHRRLFWKPKEQYLANAGYTYTSDSGFRLQFMSDFLKEKVTNKGAAQITAYEGYAVDEYYRTTRSNNRLILEGKLGKKGHWESRNGYALYHRVKEQVRKDLVSLEEIRTTGQGMQDTSTFHDITLRSNYSNSIGQLKYDAGYDVNLSYATSGKIPGGSHNINDYALYQNFSYSLLKEKLTLQVGLREIYNTQYSAPLVYSFQALYTPREDVQLRASYGKGFRSPSLKEQYLEFIDQNHHIIGNPDLKAESGDHVAASGSWQVYQQKGDYLQFILTGSYNNVYNEIVLANLDPSNPTNIDYIYTNAAHTRNTVWNLQAEQQLGDIHLVAGYGLTHTWKQENSYDAFDLQELTAGGNYYWRMLKLSFAAFYKLTGSGPAIARGIDGNAVFAGNMPAYHMLDVTVERKFWNKKIQVIAGVKNILDVQQVSTTGGAISSPGGHGTDANVSFLPRRIFTTIRLNLN